MINIGVIGCGHWGPNHIRIFNSLANSRVLRCADVSKERLKFIQNLNPNIQVSTDYREILKDPEIQAVCIATPTNTHYSLTSESLKSKKHVLCEKPLALTSKECEELKRLAGRMGRSLMVGHVFVFHSGIIRLKELIKSGEVGEIHYAHSERTNLGPFRYDVNALWDLAPHDISIFNYLFDETPLSVSARGQKCLGTAREDLAFVTLEYPKKKLVNIHVSWLDPKKIRQLTVVGDKKMVVWDDLDNLGPLKIYDKYVEKISKFYSTFGEFQLLSREGSITIPHIAAQEPLNVQARYFVDCIQNNKPPHLADAQKGGDVVRTLAFIQKSMDKGGTPISVK